MNPFAYWRLNDNTDPSTGTALAHDYIGGFAGTYGSAAQNTFNSIAGPRPSDGFNAFEPANGALRPTSNLNESWVTVPGLNLNTNTFSLTMWIKPNGPQSDYTGLFITREGAGAGIGYGGDFSANAGQLIYTWNNNTTWTFPSGLTIPQDQWSFAAVTIHPDKAILYLYNANGLSSSTNPIPHTAETWNGPARIGGDPAALARTFNGTIDELAIFNHALSPAQILDLYNGTTSVTLGLQRTGSQLTLTWPEGILQQATGLNGTWSLVTGAAPPSHTVTINPSDPPKYYRVRVRP